ncbi:STAS domain-containing protein [Roseomonas nepalensis]|uniref:STAS domain-containing protein n=1 Tax=Muricoccus nepalensis TaxID=1854500 RepID=A0A502F8T3_9PROT|nr:STAS domain-containing protein [Roseomonas nepalensis]TPG45754.1 STAS domain-containing protein [Roseomonas nepalensis]
MLDACAPPTPFILPSSLDLNAASLLREGLLVRLEAGGLELEAGAVERVSTPGLQVLAAAAASARARGAAFRLRGVPAALADAIRDLDLAAAIPTEG